MAQKGETDMPKYMYLELNSLEGRKGRKGSNSTPESTEKRLGIWDGEDLNSERKRENQYNLPTLVGEGCLSWGCSAKFW